MTSFAFLLLPRMLASQPARDKRNCPSCDNIRLQSSKQQQRTLGSSGLAGSLAAGCSFGASGAAPMATMETLTALLTPCSSGALADTCAHHTMVRCWPPCIMAASHEHATPLLFLSEGTDVMLRRLTLTIRVRHLYQPKVAAKGCMRLAD